MLSEDGEAFVEGLFDQFAGVCAQHVLLMSQDSIVDDTVVHPECYLWFGVVTFTWVHLISVYFHDYIGVTLF